MIERLMAGVEQQLEILERRIAQMVERVKRLRSERADLLAKVDGQEKLCRRLQEEQRLVRTRVEKILETLRRVESGGGRENGE